MSFAVSRSTDTRHLTQFRLDDEAVAVLRHVVGISELCLLTLALLGEFGLGVRGRAMRLVASLLAVKMARSPLRPRDGASSEPSFATNLSIHPPPSTLL